MNRASSLGRGLRSSGGPLTIKGATELHLATDPLMTHESDTLSGRSRALADMVDVLLGAYIDKGMDHRSWARSTRYLRSTCRTPRPMHMLTLRSTKLRAMHRCRLRRLTSTPRSSRGGRLAIDTSTRAAASALQPGGLTSEPPTRQRTLKSNPKSLAASVVGRRV